MKTKLNKKKIIIISLVIIFFIIAVALLIKPLSEKYKNLKLNHINKDIIIEGEYSNDTSQETYIGSSLYVDINKKRVYYVKCFKFRNGTVSGESLVNDQKISHAEINTIMDIIDSASTKKQKGNKNFYVYYKITYGDKTVYTDLEQTNTITDEILSKLIKN